MQIGDYLLKSNKAVMFDKMWSNMNRKLTAQTILEKDQSSSRKENCQIIGTQPCNHALKWNKYNQKIDFVGLFGLKKLDPIKKVIIVLIIYFQLF